MDNSLLLGKIVSWPNIGDPEEDGHVSCGRGEVIGLLEPPYMLVKRLPRSGDNEPSYLMILPMTIPNLHFFNTVKEEQKWYAWIFNDPEPVVKLVGK